MKPIATLECEDCGKFIIADSSYISVFVYDDEEAYAVSRCAYCDRVLYQPCPTNFIDSLINDGVKVFSWVTGDEVK